MILFRTTSIPLRRRQVQDSSKRTPHAPLVRRVELQHALLVRIAKKLMRQTVYTCRLPDTRHALEAGEDGSVTRQRNTHRDDEVLHVPLARDYLQPLDGLRVPDDIVEYVWPVLFDPRMAVSGRT